MSYLNAQPGFLNAQGGGAPGRKPQGPPPSTNALVRFWNEEIVHPEKTAGNLAIAWGVGIALLGVGLIRSVGRDVLVPVF